MDINSLNTPTELVNYLNRFLSARQKAYEFYNRLNSVRQSKIQKLRHLSGQMAKMEKGAIIRELYKNREDILFLCNTESSAFKAWNDFFNIHNYDNKTK